MEKILCDFLTNRTAKLRIANFKGQLFPLLSGVPQGSVISPTLYIFYVSDIPPPEAGSIDTGFADDIAQIMTYPGQSKQMLAIKTKRAIERINNYEQKWKIQNNPRKFQLRSISKTKPANKTINNNRIEFTRNTKILGLTTSRTGLDCHFKQRLTMAKPREQN